MNIFIILCIFNYICCLLFIYFNIDIMGINYIFVDVFIWGEFRFKYFVVVFYILILRGKLMFIIGMS